MHDASPMQPRERPRDGADNGHRLPHAEVAAGSDDTRERPGAHQVEHEGHGPGGLHQREGLVEPDEPLHTDPLEHGKLADRLVGVLRRAEAEGYHLDGDRQPVVQALSSPHRARAACRQLGPTR